MKLAVVSSQTSSLFNFREDMMRDFVARGYEVIALGAEPQELWAERFEAYGVRYFQISVARTGLNPINDIATFLSIRRVIKREGVDKLFLYQAKTIVYGALAARSCSCREVYPMVAGLGSILRGEGLKLRIVGAVMRWLYKSAFRCSRVVLFQNRDDMGELVDAGLLRQEQTVIVNGSGVNLRKFSPTPIPSSPLFLFVGRLIRDKGVMEYLHACEEVRRDYPTLRCLLVGAFDTNPSAIRPEELQPFIDRGVVEYMGEAEDVRLYLDICTTYILPSYHEGTPKSVLEAMAKGRAIITTDAPGCRETVEEGVNGYLVPIKDSRALAKRMRWVLENPQKNIEMGAQSLHIAQSKYDVRKVNQTIAEVMGL